MPKSTTTAAVSHSPSSSNSSSLTFLFPTPLQKPTDLNKNNNFELHECDVIWSSSSSDTVEIPSPSNVSTSPPIHRQHTSGLYAALSDDQHSVVRRNRSISPSQSAATAARTIPPVSLRRSSEYCANYHQSAPVNVPVWPKSDLRRFEDDVVDEEVEDDGEMIPPHEIVARSYVTFSVFEGAGRTLKGRDLCRVRNAVFQKTGFID